MGLPLGHGDLYLENNGESLVVPFDSPPTSESACIHLLLIDALEPIFAQRLAVFAARRRDNF